jgi:astacin
MLKAGNKHKVAPVMAAIQFFEENTCIRFKENRTNPDRVRVLDGPGCTSKLGMIGGEQELTVGNGCESTGIMIHMFAHALGFENTHTRSDRDNYVTIDMGAISYPGFAYSFVKKSEDENILYTPYEYGSVMHYAANAYSRGNNLTIVPKDRDYINTMGSNQASFFDIKMFNDHYECSENCPTSTSPKCKNGGLPNPNNCSTCICPNGYAGDLCNQMPVPSGGCGAELTATTDWQSKTFELGGRNTLRPSVTQCYHWIRAPKNSQIEVRVTNTSSICSYGCYHSGIEFKLKERRMTNPRICCDFSNNKILTSEFNPLPVIAYNRFDVSGFTFEYRYQVAAPTTKRAKKTSRRPRTRRTPQTTTTPSNLMVNAVLTP